MGTVSGYWGRDNFTLKLAGPASMNVTLPSNTYPSGTLELNSISSGSSPACWNRTGTSQTKHIDLYLCDSAGNNRVSLGGFNLSSATSKAYHTFNVGSGAQALAGKALYIVATGDTDNIESFHKITFTLGTTTLNYAVSVNVSGGGGTLRSSHALAQPGTQITLTPTANTGYQFKSYSATGGVTISNNKFTMPSSNVTVTATFEKITYTITRKSSPTAAGTVTTSAATATMGTSITVGHTDYTGYHFTGYTTSPANLISGSSFTMPASNVTITGRWKKRSTCTINKTTVTGGGSIKVTISTESSAYTHKVRLNFGTGMDTGWINVAAGVTSKTIEIDDSWSYALPNATSKTGGTLTLQTYSGSTMLATAYEITGLTYEVQASLVPALTVNTPAVARTIGGVTYANIGNYYVQNHCGVTVTGSASAQQSDTSTISSIYVAINGYSGNSYKKTVTGGSLNFTSGLLTTSGSTKITVKATDSRGRTTTVTKTITVREYNDPSGTLTVYRVNESREEDPTGQRGMYAYTSKYTNLGSNSLTVKLVLNSVEYNPSGATGDLMPSDRKNFDVLREYTIRLKLQDEFETTTVTAKLPSGKYAIFVGPYGDQIAFMKAITKNYANLPTNKHSSIEIPGDSQVYIGDDKLEDWTKNQAAEAADDLYGLYTTVAISSATTITQTVTGLTSSHTVDALDFFTSSSLSTPATKVLADFKWQTTANTLTLTVDKVYASCWVRIHFVNRK